MATFKNSSKNKLTIIMKKIPLCKTKKTLMMQLRMKRLKSKKTLKYQSKWITSTKTIMNPNTNSILLCSNRRLIGQLLYQETTSLGMKLNLLSFQQRTALKSISK